MRDSVVFKGVAPDELITCQWKVPYPAQTRVNGLVKKRRRESRNSGEEELDEQDQNNLHEILKEFIFKDEKGYSCRP